jgi:hypothetical protein
MSKYTGGQMEKESRMTVRMPTDLYEWLKNNAEVDRRSLNSQVVEILDKYRQSIQQDSKTVQE